MSAHDPIDYLRRFAGLIVIMFGVFFLAFGGLCSAVFLLSFFAEGDLINMGFALMIGLPTALVGGMIILTGRALWTRK